MKLVGVEELDAGLDPTISELDPKRHGGERRVGGQRPARVVMVERLWMNKNMNERING